MSAPMTPEEKRRHLTAAKRWQGRMRGKSRPEKLRCHKQAMQHLYAVLQYVPKDGGPLL